MTRTESGAIRTRHAQAFHWTCVASGLTFSAIGVWGSIRLFEQSARLTGTGPLAGIAELIAALLAVAFTFFGAFVLGIGLFGRLSDIHEPTEYFYVNLSNPINATLGDSKGRATILDNDPEPGILIDDFAVLAGDKGTTPFYFLVGLTNRSGDTLTVTYTTEEESKRVCTPRPSPDRLVGNLPSYRANTH